jgi:hypothetical protein
MTRTITVTLEVADILQILDALESRAEAYEKTAALIRGEYKMQEDSDGDLELDSEDSSDRFFVAEECRDASEAEEIAKHFRDIIASLGKQLSESQ